MKILSKLLLPVFPLFFLLMTAGCERKQLNLQLGDVPAYAVHPFSSIRALDTDGSQERWVEGVVDDDARTVEFYMSMLEDYNDVSIEVELDKYWSSMVWPETLTFNADLTSAYRITVNDGVDNIHYQLSCRENPLIAGIRLTLASGEILNCAFEGRKAVGRSALSYAWSALQGVRIEVELAGEASLVTPSASLEDVDFSTGETFSLVCRDESTSTLRTYVISAFPADVATLSPDWTDVTHTSPWNTAVLSDYARIYQTTELYGYEGNVGYLYTLPAGNVQMKVLEKWAHLGGQSNISSVVRSEREWTLFLPSQGPKVWKLSPSGEEVYYSPLAYGPDGSQTTRPLREEGFGGKRESGMYAPAIGIRDGRVGIRPAATKADGKLYAYSDAKGEGEALWDAECAFGGLFQLVRNGQSLITSDTDRSYEEYNEQCRRYTTMYQNLDYTWAYGPVTRWDQLRTGRFLIGCTADGGLMVLGIEKFVNTHNQGQDTDSGKNGNTDADRRGLNFYEAGSLMRDLGCSDVMTLEDLNWCFGILQDGTDRGLDFFKTNRRYNFQSPGCPQREENNELSNLAIVCFK